MASGLPRRNGQKTGQRATETQAPVGYTWADYVEALVVEYGTLAAVAWKLVERGLSEDVTSVERALRRLRGRGQRDGGLIGQRVLRVFGVPETVEALARWMGTYHSPFGDLPVQLCVDQLRLWERPPLSESKARVWILLGLAGVALRRRAFDEAQPLLEAAAALTDLPAARIEHHLATSYLLTRLEVNAKRAEAAARPHLESARSILDASRAELDPAEAACFQARLVDHEAFDANRRGDSARALALYRSLSTKDVHPFASYRRDAGVAFGLHRQGARDEALRMAQRACEHAGDGGYVRLRVMGLLMVARIQGAPDHEGTLARAAAIAKRLADPELRVRVERAQDRLSEVGSK
ncbi:hypothetical protein [Pyxidicoccus caerfyrddinensis]|uniref:hypothetical protein n=1 Tax=Pyxidicoccus caerfyrddinensis TaxID=2709663 RepID=UPI0013DD22A5|nr:hypothetical protein [Pyxidicoccus caerfyrddinensis]